MWARKYESCRGCGTSERKHYGGGLCYRCYNNAKYAQNPEPQKARSSNYYAQHTAEKIAYQAEYYRENKAECLLQTRLAREERCFSGKRTQVLRRDNHCCQHEGCAATENLVVHHIDGSGQSGEPNNEDENLVTVCRACHVRIHTPRKGTGQKKIESVLTRERERLQK